MIVFYLLLACLNDTQELIPAEEAARLWLGEGGSVRACNTYLRVCDVVTAQGLEVRLNCNTDPNGLCMRWYP